MNALTDALNDALTTAPTGPTGESRDPRLTHRDTLWFDVALAVAILLATTVVALALLA